MKIDVALSSEILGVPESHFERAQEVAARMNRDPLAMGLAQTVLDALARGDRWEAVGTCRAAKEYFQRTAPELVGGVYPALFALSTPEALRRMREGGTSEEIARDTLSDYGVWARAYRRQTGEDGFGEMEWELGFHTGRIVKLGRLQFERSVFHAPYALWRDRRSGEIVPVPHPGEAVDENGWLAQGAPAAFATVQEIRGNALRANAVDTVGARILPETVELPLDTMEPLLTAGMRTLNIHIPETGPLTDGGVAESLAQAKAFFGAEGYPCRAAVCESWLLDPALLTYGDGCGNICRFQRRFAKYPEKVTESDAVNRVFGCGTSAEDPSLLPEDSKRSIIPRYRKAVVLGTHTAENHDLI